MTSPLEDQVLRLLAQAPATPASPAQLAQTLNTPASTLRRTLAHLVEQSLVIRHGAGPATRYAIVAPGAALTVQEPMGALTAASVVPWSPAAQLARRKLRAPLGAREPVGYERALVDGYVPNVTALLPEGLAQELHGLGKTRDQQPAGTYARHVLEQLLIDLSWSSSRLEGNRLTRLDTERLFQSGATDGDPDAVMLLNHKQAIEFMVDTVPLRGLKQDVISNLHAVLMQDLLDDDASLGTIRRKVVRISDTVYLPMQMPQVLQETMTLILHKAAQVNNPLEAAFFLWVHLAYLQPFEDGNKRVSRLAANIPLMIFNCAPLSFIDVDRNDYADAMLAVYELRDMAPAADLFAWTYRRSCAKYAVILQATSAPDPVRVRFRAAAERSDGAHRARAHADQKGGRSAATRRNSRAAVRALVGTRAEITRGPQLRPLPIGHQRRRVLDRRWQAGVTPTTSRRR